MRNAISLVIVFWIFVVKATAQTNLPAVFEIRTDTIFFQNLDNSQWQMLEDKEGKWTIEQVNSLPLSAKFHRRDSVIHGADTVVKTYWFRFRLRNLMSLPAKISLDAYFERDDYYIMLQDGSIRHYVTGRHVPWKNKDGLKPRNFIPIIVQPGEEILVYDRGSNRNPGMPGVFGLDFASTEKIVQRDFVDEQDNWVPRYFKLVYFALGFFILAAFFNLFFYRATRERTYLYFALFLLFVSVEIFTQGLHRVYPALQPYAGIFEIIALLFYFLFVRHYFKTFSYAPRWDKFLLAISGLIFINVILRFIFPEDAFVSNTSKITAYFINPATLLITFILFARKHKQTARFFMIAVLPDLLFQFFFGLSLTITQVGMQPPYFLPWIAQNANAISITTMSWMILLFTLVLFRRYDQQRKEIAQQQLDKERLAREKEIERSNLIEQQKIELEKTVEERTAELKQSLKNLQDTQAQLIQSEKMASLGELTAGIAHEIQNPLNFVNNFSEVNEELLKELKAEAEQGDLEEVKAIAKDIEFNSEKINQHGKRAEAIVKGMLQHSRTSSGQKEPTDINALTDEYLRLAYHGLRAKDKSFNASFKTDFDDSIGKINIVPQDIGRVILNLINNAFYAVSEKQKENLNGYEPLVTVSTARVNDKIEITVKDNGNGIPQVVLDKIFQPFFTTKPTGQGTGLGLSISYDIVKAHGGEIKAETKEGEGSAFIIQLPTK
jgi:two-component system NtrC family sensor kinase